MSCIFPSVRRLRRKHKEDQEYIATLRMQNAEYCKMLANIQSLMLERQKKELVAAIGKIKAIDASLMTPEFTTCLKEAEEALVDVESQIRVNGIIKDLCELMTNV